jgi:large subunit ribosomal protein L15
MSIELSNLKPAAGSRRKYKRVGRGNASGKGTTAGKGTKGQRARQGGRKGLRQLGQKWATQATPKLAGRPSIYKKSETLPVSVLNKFSAGDTITVATLIKSGLIPHAAKSVKLVDSGKLSKKVNIKGLAVSSGARVKIEAIGGTIA